jgi:hypothetical protein
MIDASVASARMAIALVIAAYGIAKLLQLPRSAREVWAPSWVPPSFVAFAIVIASFAEIADVALVGVAVSVVAAVLVVVPQSVILTAYGLAAGRKAGSCGCGGNTASHPDRGHSGIRLVGRNAVLFGGGVVGVVAAPPLWRWRAWM